jgi:hypothetical protein
MTVFAGLLFATPAHACVLGWGSDCPITKSEAAKLIKEKVDGKPAGEAILDRKLGAILGPLNDQATVAAVQQRMAWITGDKPCAQMPTMEVRRGHSPASVCEWGRYLHQTGLFTLLLKATPHSPGLSYDIRVEMNVKGLERMKDLVISVQKSDGFPYIKFATYTRRFVEVLRTRDEKAASQTTAIAEFGYEEIPSVWARIEKKKDVQADMPSVKKNGTARFEKWSDGWRLVDLSLDNR